MDTKKILDIVALVLVIIGGLNWGLVALANMDLVKLLFGGIAPLDTIVYVLVALSALYTITILLEKTKK
jgi:uncharacterized protein